MAPARVPVLVQELVGKMEQPELLNEFNAFLSKYAQHREYIRRAQSQASRFSKAIIEKVMLDHEVKASQIADDILPLVPSLQSAIRTIDDEKVSIHNDKAAADEEMEELNLRLAIGEVTDEEFESLGHELRDHLEAANGRLGDLDGAREHLAKALDSWVALAAEGQQPNGLEVAAPPPVVAAPAVVPAVVVPAAVPPAVAEPLPQPVVEAPAPIAPPAPVAETIVEPDLVSIPLPVPAHMAETVVPPEADDGQHTSTSRVKDDVSAVFDNAPSEAAVRLTDDAAVAETIEANAGEDEFEVDFDEPVEAGPPISHAQVSSVSALSPPTDPGAPASPEMDVFIPDPDHDTQQNLSPVSEAPASAEDQGRRAILLYQENTADEQIYPFTNDVLTVGRGRDNDIQIRNDSKVSRFHCKLFKRGGNFYVEDNKSSNGTLVNGELITERRLFGGEEVIIGETFFRFRVL